MLAELETKLVKGGEGLAAKDSEQAKKYRMIQKQLKVQKQREEVLLKERQEKEEQMLTVQNTYKDLQSEVEAQRIIIKKF